MFTFLLSLDHNKENHSSAEAKCTCSVTEVREKVEYKAYNATSPENQ